MIESIRPKQLEQLAKTAAHIWETEGKTKMGEFLIDKISEAEYPDMQELLRSELEGRGYVFPGAA